MDCLFLLACLLDDFAERKERERDQRERSEKRERGGQLYSTTPHVSVSSRGTRYVLGEFFFS